MKVYLDAIFILNFCFDFLLLLSVSIMLRRNVGIKKILIGSFVGGMSIFSLFINVNSLLLFLIKLLISIIMVLTSFGFKNIQYTLRNLGYLYMSSIILGGFLYFLNIEFSYKQEGLVFYHNGLSINFIVLIILSPVILYIYIRQAKQLKNTYSLYHKIDIYANDKVYKLNGFLDTGNKLIDPISHKPVIIVREKYFNELDPYIYIPYNTVTENGVMKCIKADKIKIGNSEFKQDVLVGLIKNLKMEGIDCILNSILMEEI